MVWVDMITRFVCSVLAYVFQLVGVSGLLFTAGYWIYWMIDRDV